jgi:glycosyltransferase involved in cell wall biosynthesis
VCQISQKLLKRILLVIPNLDFGGAQNSFWRLSLLLSPYAELKLVAFNLDRLAPQPHAGELCQLNVPAGRTWMGKTTCFFLRVIRLRRIKSEFRPDVSISFLEGADYVNLLSAVGERIFFYIHGSKLHDHNVRGLLGTLRKKFFIPVCYRRADAILVVNRRLEEEYKNAFRLDHVPFYEFPNFYDFQQLHLRALEPVGAGLDHLFRTKAVIGIMGRLAEEKGIVPFLNFLPSLLVRKPDARVILIGDGPEKSNILAAARSLGLTAAEVSADDELVPDASILLMGYQQNPHRLLARCRLLALPSRNEGMPNSLVEAMGLGVPVVASDCPYGPAELLSPAVTPPVLWPGIAENGVLLPAPEQKGEANTRHWVDALVDLLSDSSLRARLRESGERFAFRFSTEAVAQRWTKLIQES